MTHAQHIGGTIIDRSGGRYSIEDAKLIANVCRQLADVSDRMDEIENRQWYAALAIDFRLAATEADMWRRASSPIRDDRRGRL